MTRIPSATDTQSNDHEEIAALHEQLARTALIFSEMEQTARTGGYILDVATQTLFWSPGMHRIYETDPASFVPSVAAIARFHSPETAHLVEQNRQQLLDLSAREFSIDLDVCTARGNHIFVHAISRSEVIEGKVTRIFGTAQDVTERTRAERALRESEESYHNLFAFNSSIMLLIDPADGRIIDANHAAVKFYGYRRDTLLAMRISEINTLPEEQVRQEMNSIVLEHGKHFRFLHRLADGSLRDVEVSSSRIQVGGHTVLHSIVYDVSERTRTELALRELEERYRLIYENSSEAILFTGPDGKVYSANPEACRILGRSEAEIIAAGRSGLIDPKDAGLSHALEERRRTGCFKGELTFLKGDGTPFPAEVSTKLFLDSQGHERTSMFIRDISEKKQAERLLRQSNENLRMLSNHLTTIRENERTLIAREVHDELGQVFTALKMEVMALLRSQSAATDELPPGAYTIMQMIETGIKSVQQISSRLRPRLLDDFGLIPAIEWQAEEFQKRTKIPIGLTLPKDDLAIPAEISTAVFRIVQESLTNIARHAGATAITLTLGYEETAGQLVFTIHDNGRGVTEAELADTHSFGLIGIRERLRALGGRVEFTNHPDGGMQIHASIPMPSSDSTTQTETDNNDQSSDRR